MHSWKENKRYSTGGGPTRRGLGSSWATPAGRAGAMPALPPAGAGGQAGNGAMQARVGRWAGLPRSGWARSGVSA